MRLYIILNCYSLIVVSVVTGCISISAHTSLVGIFIDIASSALGVKTCAITAEIKNYESIIKLNTTEVLNSWVLINSYVNHDLS